MDIFEIKKKEIVFKIGGEEYPLVDPPFPKRVALLKKGESLDQRKGELSTMQFLVEANELNLENIKLFLPTLTDEAISKIGSVELNSYLAKIMDLMSNQFGSVVEKVEKK